MTAEKPALIERRYSNKESEMEQKILDQTTMIQYLLGLLSEDDRSRLEETFFKHDEYFDDLIALEDDLIDDYVNDRLPDSFRIAFEEKLKSNPHWKQRLGVAGALSRHAAGLRTKPFRPRHQNFRLTLLAGAAAALVLLSIAAWQVIEQRGNVETLRAERRNADATIRNVQTELAKLQARDQDLSRQLEEGGLVRSADMLRARTTDSGKAVVIDLPPQFLAPGNYEVELLGLVDPGKFEEVAYYNFTVQEK